MKELIEFLEKKGFIEQANSLKNGDTSLNLNCDIFDAEKAIGENGAKELAAVLKSNYTLTSLSLWGNQIGENGARELAEVLKFNATLTLLDLASNKIGDSEAKELAEVLKSNPTLTSLYLWGNQIGENGAKEIYVKRNKDDLVKEKITAIKDNVDQLMEQQNKLTQNIEVENITYGSNITDDIHALGSDSDFVPPAG